MDNKRDFKGIWIPKEIWLNNDLKVMEKLFLVEIDSLDNDEGCFASNDYFAKFFDLSKNRCSEIIKSLEKKGYVSISYAYKSNSKEIDKRIIKCIRNIEWGTRKTDRGIRNIDKGYSEKCEDNNTLYNNTFNNIYSDFAKELVKIYPGKKIKDTRDKKVPKLLKKHGIDEIRRCVQRYADECKKQFEGYVPLNESTFWNGRYKDYLDDNYIPINDTKTTLNNQQTITPKRKILNGISGGN